MCLRPIRNIDYRPRLLSNNWSSYIEGDLADFDAD
jgi:hypothetical protein